MGLSLTATLHISFASSLKCMGCTEFWAHTGKLFQPEAQLDRLGHLLIGAQGDAYCAWTDTTVAQVSACLIALPYLALTFALLLCADTASVAAGQVLTSSYYCRSTGAPVTARTHPARSAPRHLRARAMGAATQVHQGPQNTSTAIQLCTSSLRLSTTVALPNSQRTVVPFHALQLEIPSSLESHHIEMASWCCRACP